MLEYFFKSFDLIVVTAQNGHEAYEQVEKSMIDQRLMFDLVVLDLNMPITSGKDACK